MDDTVMRWPRHASQVRPWQQRARGGTREDRVLREVTTRVPPFIAGHAVVLESGVAAELESATREIVALDAAGEGLEPLGALLLRTESVASSKIEAIEAAVDDYARALHGNRSNASAVAMVAATNALHSMIDSVGPGRGIDLASVLGAHAALMRDDPGEAHHAGRLRDVQNWIGGSDHSPRSALYVPPPPGTVGDLMADLFAFTDREDLPALAQAALAHAQFESVHPFTDGNGRIGRALINAILRRRGVTTRVVVPLASALVAHRDRYFDVLDGYREGDIRPLLSTVAESSRIAARESRSSARRLGEIAGEWRAATGPVRRGSAAGKLLDVLPARPVLSAEDAVSAVDAPRSSVFTAIGRLHDAGVLRPLTDRKRDQVWGAAAVLDELDDLGARIAAAAR